MASKFRIETVFFAKDQISKPVRKIQQRVRNFTRNAKRGFRSLNRSVNKFGASLKKAAIGGGVAFAAMSAGLISVIKTGASFEKTLVSAVAKFPGQLDASSDAYKRLEAQARKTGRETEFSATQAAAGLNFLAMAGFNAEQAIAALPGVVDLATASGIELDAATDIASDTLSAFGLMTKDTAKLTINLARVNDVLAKTTTSANTDMVNLFETVKKGGSVMLATGQSIETFAALSGIMANSALKGAEAGSNLKNIMLKLAAPTKEAASLIKKYAGSVQDADGNMLDIVDIIGEFEKGFKGLGNVEKSKIMDKIFGKRAIVGFNILLTEGADNIRKYRDTLLDAEGAAAKMAATMRDTVQGRIDTLNSSFESLKITIFDLNKGAISGFIEKITESIRRVDTMIFKNKEFSLKFQEAFIDVLSSGVKIVGILIGSIIAWKLAMFSLGVVITTFNGLILLSKGIIIAWGIALKGLAIVLNIAKAAVFLFNIALMLNPIGAIILGIGLLIAAFAVFILNLDKIQAAVVFVMESIRDNFQEAVDFISRLMEKVLTPFSTLFKGVIRIKEAISFSNDAADSDIDKNKSEAANPSVLVTPGERISKSFEERRDTIGIEIDDKTNSAKVVKEPSLGTSSVKIADSGAF